MASKRSEFTVLYVLVSAAIAFCALPSLVRAEPASPEGAAAISAKWSAQFNNATGTDLYIRLFCASPAHPAEKTPDGIGAYQFYWSPNGNLDCAFYWSPNTGAHGLWGFFLDKFASLNFEVGVGYPLIDISFTPNAPQSLFTWFSKLQNGQPQTHLRTAMYMNPVDGDLYAIGQPVEPTWSANGWENGKGYPASDAIPNNTAFSTCWSQCSGFNKWQYFEKYGASGNIQGRNCFCFNGTTGGVWVAK